GVATFDDYAFGAYGSSYYGDRPFQLQMAQTADSASAQSTIEGLPIHGGSDGPESAFEGLYQALTGAGYDLDCDGALDPKYDVLPSRASATEPFAGAAGETYDATALPSSAEPRTTVVELAFVGDGVDLGMVE